MRNRRCSIVVMSVLFLSCTAVDGLSAAELADPGFEALAGKTIGRNTVVDAWSIPPGQPYADGIEVEADKTAAHGGQAGLRLQKLANGRLAGVQQRLSHLVAGIYEFKVWAKGKGALILQTETLRRRGDLTTPWAEYSLTFEQPKAGAVDLMILADGNAQVDDASLSPASAERQAAWKEQEKARAKYGFVPEYFAAQSPQPGAPDKPAGTFQDGPVTWREKVVFYDRTYDSCHIGHPEAVARYLGANGFRVLEAAPFGQWVRKATRDGAYGTVCVMTHGICPASVYDDKALESPIRKYLEAGGRVLWLGDVPLFYVQDDVHPQIFDKTGPGEILGVRAGYEFGCWNNRGDAKVSVLGRRWGLADAGGTLIAAYPEDITATLSGFYSDYAASELAVYWLKNLSPLHPWSGFISGFRATDMGNPAIQQSVYRLALYAGKAVESPAGTAGLAKAAAASPLNVILDPPRNRRCYYRGEKIPVRIETEAGVMEGALHLSLVRNGESFPSGDCPRPTKEAPAQVEIPTANLACGDYLLRVRADAASTETVVDQRPISICPRRDDPTFFFGVTGAQAGNPYRQEMLQKDLVSAGMNTGAVTVETPTALLDLAMKSGLRFSLRAHGNSDSRLSKTEREEAERRGPNGEKILGAWEGGRPILGLLHPKRRQLDAEDMARQIKQMSAWPACWPRCQTSDDFSVYYGWDYSDLAKRTFREKTGLEPPVPPEMAKLQERFQDAAGSINRPKGVVPENDPWLQWTAFATRDIAGGYNKVVTEATVKAVPNTKIGPVPGGMQIPLCLQGQYPPHQFGVNGFNLLYYYYYLGYWQPEIGNAYWDEIARMNNRDLELWTEPDCTSGTEPTYYRNTFFLHLAGGCQGLTYFSYGTAPPESWRELSRLGNHVVRPLYPFLGKLRPASTKAGLLLPYTQFAHAVYYPTNALYAYANLLGAHLDVQPTCEEEAISGYIGNYQAVLLWHVEWMRASAVKALEDYIGKGGVVLADSTTTVPINGAIKLPVDLAMGDAKSKPSANDPRQGGPGIKDYLHPDRVASIRAAVNPYLQPWADCADPTLMVRRHAYHGVTYLWLVNLHSQEEYEYVRERVGAGVQPADPEKAKKEASQYLAERTQGKRFTPRMTIPAGNWAAYDVFHGRRVPLKKEGNRLAFTADMERLGGTLVALYPEAVDRVHVTLVGGDTLHRGQDATLEVRVLGRSGKALPGTQPLEVMVFTPQGEWPEVTGAHATEDGVWSATLRPAVNDPVGAWTIRVRELSSGTTTEVAFQVQ